MAKTNKGSCPLWGNEGFILRFEGWISMRQGWGRKAGGWGRICMYFVHRYVCMSVHDSLSLEKGREGHKQVVGRSWRWGMEGRSKTESLHWKSAYVIRPYICKSRVWGCVQPSRNTKTEVESDELTCKAIKHWKQDRLRKPYKVRFHFHENNK